MSFSLTLGATYEVTELLCNACHLFQLKYFIGFNTCIKNFSIVIHTIKCLSNCHKRFACSSPFEAESVHWYDRFSMIYNDRFICIKHQKAFSSSALQMQSVRALKTVKLLKVSYMKQYYSSVILCEMRNQRQSEQRQRDNKI